MHDYWASMLTSDFLGEPRCSKVRGLDAMKCVVAWACRASRALTTTTAARNVNRLSRKVQHSRGEFVSV